jgi:hypothetical protein
MDKQYVLIIWFECEHNHVTERHAWGGHKPIPVGCNPGTTIRAHPKLDLMLMHVKCIHDLCTLPLDIPPYLHHILVIFMLFDDYWE